MEFCASSRGVGGRHPPFDRHEEPIELPGGHFPMVEAPAAFADLLDRLAETAIGQ